MLIYNVTINIDESVHDQWLDWMKDKHMPDMLATGKFSHAKMVKVLVEEDMGGITYSIQYTTQSRDTLRPITKRMQNVYAPMRKKCFPTNSLPLEPN